jgi:ribosomal protein S18 acetylase RimI-like enzyme
MQPLSIRPVATAIDIETVARLAKEIWYEHYVPIIGREQVDYMVPRMQSVPAIAAQIAEGYEYFLAAVDGEEVGYAAVRSEDGAVFLSKLYVRKSARRSGIARRMLAHLEDSARVRGLRSIWLTVNKENPALQAYLRLGFRVTGPIVTDIGDGFVMDDYRMEKTIQ